MQASIARHGATWIDLTNDQLEFLRGFAAMNPLTPPGIPPGDKAAMGVKDGLSVVFFIDAGQVCLEMYIPKTALDMLDDVASGTIMHEGQGL